MRAGARRTCVRTPHRRLSSRYFRKLARVVTGQLLA